MATTDNNPDAVKALGDHEPIPDELCIHVELGVEMTGGWLFAAEDPPKAVGMCHECIVWCKDNLLPATSWSEYVSSQNKEQP